MAGMEDNQKVNEDEASSSFVWDPHSQLYYHASSGFYHNPNAGWYYSTIDGLYYKFENGNYVQLESVQTQDETGICAQSNENLDHALLQNGESNAYDIYMETRHDKSNTGNTDSMDNELPENPPLPSEWLEDTHIELYLSGYSKSAIDAPCGKTASDEMMLEEINGVESFRCSIEGARIDDAYTLEEGEWIPDENDITDEGMEDDQKVKEDEASSSFVWDPHSQLYYHSSSGFYHDPNAGWYYSTSDGLYYKFENGNYVQLESVQTQDEAGICAQSNENLDHALLQNGESNAYDIYMETRHDKSNTGNTDSMDNELTENPPPPSEWLEDTLIELYLSGYSKSVIDAPCGTNASDERMLEEINGVESFGCSIEGARTDAYTLEEGEWIPDENDITDEGASQDEENWQAQYGQVIESDEQVMAFPLVDFWDWKMVRGTKKNGKGEVARLVGRLVRRSMKLHPSVPSGSGLLKTAPICEAHLDLVRVTSGQVYKLRTPSASYLASMLAYDSSNPTKDWGYPQLSTKSATKRPCKLGGNCESTMIQGNPVCKDSLVPGKLSVAPKAYRDRAAERRVLHGGFGLGPGQKHSPFAVDAAPSSPVSDNHEVAAAESLNMSFGAGSYARKILESMGWQEGEALGSSVKGLTEPLQAVGNKGNAGLGWDHSRR